MKEKGENNIFPVKSRVFTPKGRCFTASIHPPAEVDSFLEAFNNPGHEKEHVFGMVKDEKDSSYYPGCVHCQQPVTIVQEGQIEFKNKPKDSPVN
ncbi:MAG: hypothetical protein MUP45_03780 [Candidatus Marinimicrobia bacterium]|nr:hypothetical protein [Candidatus Neomarinimicrobiota bacterium]